jgi:hypothetical protein
MRVSIWMAAIGPVMLAAACAAPGPVDPGVPSVRAEPRPGVTTPLARGETSLVVRAVPAGPTGQEVQGAACLAETGYFTAEFVSPARILMPDLGEAAPVVSVACRAGDTSGSAEALPERAWSGGLGGWPAVGISVGTGDAAGVGVGLGWQGGSVGGTGGVPVVRYRELRVPLS